MLFLFEYEPVTLWSAASVASLIILVGWSSAVYLIVKYVNRLVQEMSNLVYEEVGDIRYLIYGVSVLFWPAALVFGIYFLGKGKNAKVGRICIFILLGTFTLCFLAAIVIVMLGVAYFPEIAEYLLE